MQLGEDHGALPGAACAAALAHPPASLLNPLFEPIDPGDTGGFPTTLGIDKAKFFSDFNNGWGLRRMVCG